MRNRDVDDDDDDQEKEETDRPIATLLSVCDSSFNTSSRHEAEQNSSRLESVVFFEIDLVAMNVGLQQTDDRSIVRLPML